MECRLVSTYGGRWGAEPCRAVAHRPWQWPGVLLAMLACHLPSGGSFGSTEAAELRARVVDDASGTPIASRVYLQDASGKWLFVKAGEPAGSALPYQEQWVPMEQSVERHTTVSAHPFRIDLAPGTYVLEVERGKEYRPLRRKIEIGTDPLELTLRLTRWMDMAARGWYSGETHVHRRLSELPQVMLAEDLNVAFPVAFWTVQSDKPPGLEPSPLRSQGPSPFGPREDRGTSPIQVDATHIILPRNTEYEIFSVDGRPHTLGAVFVLNHQSVFTAKAPPIAPIAEQARAEGALLDLDKHSWPWSMMLVPVAKVDLYELSNNSVWRTRFGFNRLPAALPPWMHVETDTPTTMTEWGWLNYGFEIYYALLNCGFRLSPTAGTASGVHPVPLGYSRVYVHTGDRFDLRAWLSGLKAGRSFVTTGPMLLVTVNGQLAGETLAFDQGSPVTLDVAIEAVSDRPVSAIELLVQGRVVETLTPAASRTPAGAFASHTRHRVMVDASSWLAVRCREPQPDGRQRFAHTAPWFVSIGGEPAAPRREQVEYLVSLMQNELNRNRGILAPPALEEFAQALEVYRSLLARAR